MARDRFKDINLTRKRRECGHDLRRTLPERGMGRDFLVQLNILDTTKEYSLTEHSVDLDSYDSRGQLGVYHIRFLYCLSRQLISGP